MKHYAVFINGVRGGTIAFQNTDYGNELKNKLLKLSPTVVLKPIENEEDVYCREMMKEGAYRRYIATAGGIGAQMVRQMISQYEMRGSHPYD